MIGPVGIGVASTLLGKLIDRIIPNRENAKEHKREIETILVEAQEAEHKALAEDRKAQTEINKIEAAHRNLFVSGWRPAIGWVCALGVFWTFLGLPFTDFALDLYGSDILLPAIPEDRVFELVFALLGMSTLRTVEKFGHVARSS